MEIGRPSHISGSFLIRLLSGVALAYPGVAFANPTDGVVSRGSATIQQSGSTVSINQTTDKAIIDWRGFDIGVDEKTIFNQPGSNSVTLNRINSANPSQILGTLSANGKIILINPAGIFFGAGSKVDVSGLVATTADIKNENFMKGDFRFDIPGHPDASIINEGVITAKDAGLVGLVAPNVINRGVITANLGRIQLSSGDTATVDLYGDGLMEVAVSNNVKTQLVENTGVIQANGGKIALTAAAGGEIVKSLINIQGEVRAGTVKEQAGGILISNAKPAGSTATTDSKVVIGGRVTATGTNTGEKGGSVEIYSNQINLGSGSLIDTSGFAGGGKILIGGDEHGITDVFANALNTTVEAGAQIKADALADGAGGKVIVWSDKQTDYKGGISAKGVGSGDGGFAEVSGKKLLNYNGSTDLTAANGNTGTLLLDPENVTIQTSGTPAVSCSAGVCTPFSDDSILTIATLQSALASSNVIVSTGSSGTQDGNITVANDITWSSSNRLVLSAYNNITINSGVTIKNTYGTSLAASANPTLLVLRADANSLNNGGSVINNGTIDFSASTGAVAIFYDSLANGGSYAAGTLTPYSGTWVAPTNASVSSQFTAYQLLNNLTDVVNIHNDLTANYALGKNIDGGNTEFNSSSPLGVFTGILDGQYGTLIDGSNYGITGLTMNITGSSLGQAGFFNSMNGIARNFTLGLDLTSNFNGTTIVRYGTLAAGSTGVTANVVTTGNINYTYSGSDSCLYCTGLGDVYGAISSSAVLSNVSASGAVNLTYSSNGTTNTLYVGGLVGAIASGGTPSISGSSASGAVTVQYGSGYSAVLTDSIFIGGLVGQMGAGSVSNSYATGTITGNIDGANIFVGGLIGSTGSATGISFSHATNSINYTGNNGSFYYIGGLVGAGSASISNSYSHGGNISATNIINGTVGNIFYVGGLVGSAGAAVAISDSDSSDNVTYTYRGTTSATNTVYMGGLVGRDLSSATNIISNSNSTGSVLAQYATGYSGTVGGYIGGLVGQVGNNDATGVFSGSSSSSNVTNYLIGANEYVGGLIGYDYSSGTISSVHATGTVTVTGTSGSVGGLIGKIGVATGTVNNAYATGDVVVTYSGTPTTSASLSIGGLVGHNVGVISNSQTYTGQVKLYNTVNGGTSSVTFLGGGLVGYNNTSGSIIGSTASESVIYNYRGSTSITGVAMLGGLVGENISTITNSISTSSTSGNVLAQYTTGYSGNMTSYLGGLVGQIGNNDTSGVFTGSTSSGNVTSYLQGGTEYVGGLIGYDYSTSNLAGLSSSANVIYNGASGSSIGGLIGYINSSITLDNSHATGNVSNTYSGSGSASSYTGGLVGTINSSATTASITNSDSQTGAVTATTLVSGTGAPLYYTGGLTGNLNGAQTIVNSFSTENVTFTYKGTSTGILTADVGGLSGNDFSTATNSISNSYASGNVLAQYYDSTYSNGIIKGYVGGLVGMAGNANAAGTFSNAWATGNVTSYMSNHQQQYVGGLVGWDRSTLSITNVHATGNVTYSGSTPSSGLAVGGLIGFQDQSAGTIDNAYATGNVTTTYTGAPSGASTSIYTGGLIGNTAGAITNSHSSGGTVTDIESFNGVNGYDGRFFTGGLIGSVASTSSVSNSYSSDNVSYLYKTNSSVQTYAILGGLIGYNSSLITNGVSNSYATGNVSAAFYDGTYAGYVTSEIGGLMGRNGSNGTTSSTQIYATGNVTSSLSGTGSQNMGGLVGNNYTTLTTGITDSYATGNVTYNGLNTASVLGGLVGIESNSTSGIARVYSTGAVISNNGGLIGGLVGKNAGTINDGYWDTVTSGKSSGVGSNTGTANVTGYTTAQMQANLTTNFPNFSTSTWGIVAGNSYPYLLWQFANGTTPQVLAGYAFNSPARQTPYTDGLIYAYVDNTFAGSAKASSVNGYYSILVPQGTIQGTGSNVLIYIPGTTAGTATGVSFTEGVTGSVNALNFSGGNENTYVLSLFNNSLWLGSVPGSESSNLSGLLAKLATEQTASGITGPYTISGSTITMTGGANLVIPMTKSGGTNFDITINVPHTMNPDANLFLLSFNSNGVIVAPSDPSNGMAWVDSTKVQSLLSNDNVVIEAINGPLTYSVFSTISWASNSMLALNAATNVVVNGTITNTYANTGSYGALTIPVQLVLRADMFGTNSTNNGSVTNNGTINFSSSTGAISVFIDRSTYGGSFTQGTINQNSNWSTWAATNLTNQTVSTQLTTYSLINTVTDLAAINSGLSGTYAFGKLILGGYSAFNSNTPMGTFTGILDGQYCVLMGGSVCGVTQLTLAPSASTANVGMFGNNTGKLRSYIVGMDITQAYTGTSAVTLGVVTAGNGGTITNVTSMGNITYSYTNAPSSGSIYVGGLVGINTAASGTAYIINSTAKNSTINFTSLYNGSTAVNLGVGGLLADNTTNGYVGGSTSSNSVNYIFKDTNYATATTTNNYYLGGLVGANLSTSSSIVSSSATGSVTGSYFSSTYATTGKTLIYMGGLTGNNSSNISSSFSSATVVDSLANGTQNVGGLVGNNGSGATINTNSYATGNVTYTGVSTTSGTATSYVGGLVGNNSTATIANSYATGNVYTTYIGTPTAGVSQYVGGLVGTTNGSISSSYTQNGTVYATNANAGTSFGVTTYAGGLAGSLAAGTITDSTSSEAIIFTSNAAAGITNTLAAGGLVASDGSTTANSISGNSYATGSITAANAASNTSTVKSYIGGLIGFTSTGAITIADNLYATENITDSLIGDNQFLGGLIGYNQSSSTSTLTGLHASGNVTDTYTGATTTNGVAIGGLIGFSNSALTFDQAYATGNITLNYGATGGQGAAVGGLVGNTSSTIYTHASTSAGIVTANETSDNTSSAHTIYTGGLIGYFNSGKVSGSNSSESVIYNYKSTATVTHTATIGGLIGTDVSTTSNAFVDNFATGTVTAQYGTGYTGVVTTNAGGLVGRVGATNAVSIAGNSYATGNVNVTVGGGSEYVGGLIGYYNSTANMTGTGTNTGIRATGEVTYSGNGTSVRMGGLIGNQDQSAATLDQVYATGNVTGTYIGTPNALPFGIGGLIGYNYGAITNSYTQTGAVKGINMASGTTTANNANMYVGGLVGRNETTGSVANSHSLENVTYTHSATSTSTNMNESIGGLIGNNLTTVANGVSNSYATGTVLAQYGTGYSYDSTTGAGYVNAYLGGLIGNSGSSGSTTYITNGSYASGNVTDYLNSGLQYVGGLIGNYQSNASLSGLHASGTVTYSGNASSVIIGGLIGDLTSTGTLSNMYATGDVIYTGTKTGTAGGLIGRTESTSSTIDTSTASGNVTFTFTGTTADTNSYGTVGGLIGFSNSTVTNSSTSGGLVKVIDQATNGTTFGPGFAIGGFIGQTSTGSGAITNDYSTENVTYVVQALSVTNGSVNIGGLIGYAGSASNPISASYAKGNLTATYYDNTYNTSQGVKMGGLVGQLGNGTTDTAFITTSYATGNVTSSINTTTSSESLGGLVGNLSSQNANPITDSYAWGSVSYTGSTTSSLLGGLVGYMNDTGGTIARTYSIGYVSNTVVNLATGGLIGSLAAGTTADSYWDMQTSGQTTSAGPEIGKTTAQMQAALPVNWSPTIWSIDPGSTYAYFGSQFATPPEVIGGIVYFSDGSVAANVKVSLLINGTAYTNGSGSTGASGYYFYYVPAGTLSNAEVLVYRSGSGSTKGQTLGENITGTNTNLNIYSTYLTINTADASLTTALGNLATAQGANTGSNFTYTNNGSSIVMSANNNLSLVMTNSSPVINAAITTSGTGIVAINTTGSLTQSAAITAPNLVLTGGTGNFTLTNSSNNIGAIAANAGTLNLNDSNHDLVISTIAGTTGVHATNLYINDSGAVTQTVAINATNLSLTGTNGNYTLTNASNSISSIAANAGTLNLNNGANDLSITSINGTSGITVFNFYLTDSGNLSQLQAVTANSTAFNGSGATYSLTNSGNNLHTIAANVGTLNLNNGSNNLAVGLVNNISGITATNFYLTDSGTTTQSQIITATNMTLTNGSYTLTGNNNVSNLAATGAVTLNFSNGGNNLTIANVNSIAGISATSLYLADNAVVTQNEAISVTNLLTSGTGEYRLTNSSNSISNLAGTAGTLDINNGSNNLFVTSINSVNGLSATNFYLNDSGTITQDQGITVSGNASFIGTGSTYNLASTNNIANISANVGSLNLNNGANNINIATANGYDGITTSGATTILTSGTLKLTKTIIAGGGGNSIVLSDGVFTNNFGAGALNPGTGGRFLVYSANPANDSRNNLAFDFKLYNQTYAGYGPSSVTQSGNGFIYSIAPVLNIISSDATRAYGYADNLSAYTVTGYIDGDTASTAYSGTPSLTTTSLATSNAGSTFTITVGAGSLTANLGYQFNYVSTGTLTITKADITAVVNDQSRAYGYANPTITTADVVWTGLKNGEDSSVLDSATFNIAGANSASNAGTTHAISIVSFNDNNYNLVSSTNGTLTITKADITAVVNDQSRAYGAANPTLTTADVTWTGLRNSEDSSVLDSISFNYAGSATSTANAGTTHAISIASFNDNNYNLTTSTNGTLTITKAQLTAVVNNQSRAYGATNPTVTAADVTWTGLANGEDSSVLDSVGLTISASANSTANAGTTHGISISSFSDNNYDLASSSDGTLTITKAALTAVVHDQSRAYGSANPTLTAADVTWTGFANSENYNVIDSIGFNIAAGATSNVGGNYAISISSFNDNNYSLNIPTAVTNGHLDVTKAVLTAVVNDEHRIYGDANPNLSAYDVTWTGLKNNETAGVLDSVALSIAGSATSTANAGTTHLISLTSFSDNNYSLNLSTGVANGILTIDKAQLYVIAQNTFKILDNVEPVFAVYYSGFKNNQDASALGGTLHIQDTSSGTSVSGIYDIVPSGYTSNNYDIHYVNGKLIVNPPLPDTVTQVSQKPTMKIADVVYNTALSQTISPEVVDIKMDNKLSTKLFGERCSKISIGKDSNSANACSFF